MSRNLPYTPLDLPATEAPPFEQPSRNAGAAAGPSADSGTDSPADTGAGAGIGNFDFSAFLNSVPTDTPPPPDEAAAGMNYDDIFNDTAPQADSGAPDSIDETPSTDDLLASLGGDAQAEETPAQSTDDFLASLGGDTPAEEPPAQSTDDFLASLGGDAQAEETPAEEPPAQSADDFLASLGDDAQADETPAEEPPAQSADDFLASLGGDTPTADEAPSASGDDFSVPTDLLSGLSDEIESTPADFPPEETPAEDAPAEDDEQDESLDLGGERQDGSLGTDSVSQGFFAPKDEDDETDTTDSADASADTDLPDAGAEPDTAGLDLPDTSVSDIDLPSTDFDLPDAGAEPDTAGLDLPDIDLPSTDFDLPDAGATVPDAEDQVTDTIDMGGEPQEDEESIDMGGETPDADSGTDDFNLPGLDTTPDAAPAGDFGFEGGDSLPDMPDFDTTEPPATADSAADDSGGLPDMGDFDTTEPPAPAVDSAADDSASLPDMGDLGDDFLSESIDLENEPQSVSEFDSGPAPSATFTDDDFNLPGLDEIFEKSKVDTTPKPAPKKGFFRRRKEEAEEEAASEDSDEIKLSQEDLDNLLATLATYPLNLRVACEELIAEQVILPQQLSKLIRMLVKGARVKEMAEFAGSILGKEIVIPKSYEKSTGAEWEAEKTSFAYIFVHNFLPVLRIVALALAMLGSIGYLSYKFIYLPLKAESLYKRGYERIGAGEYQRANELFEEASKYHRKKKWFYTYAEGFRDQRRYLLAENKYDELLRFYPRDKKGVLDYANLETNYLLNYEKADKLLQHELLDYAPNDVDGLLAAGDNFLAWADSDPSKFYDKYEDARFCFARVLQIIGWTGPVLERMLLYFMHTDNLKETLNLRAWFENNRKKYKLSTPVLAELGGYLLDKQLEKPKGVPNAYVESIESVRDMLLQAVKEDNLLPEPHYHLARYYKNLGNIREERLTLENAIRAYDLAKKESVRRRLNRVDTHYRYANLLINNKEFFPAEEQLVRGIELYEDFVNRNLIAPTPQLGQLYAGLGDLEYFVKSGNIQAALNNYLAAEKYGYAPPEIQYRMGAAYYQQEKWGNALDYLFKASSELPQNRRILFALGNATFKRGDYFAAQGYYNRLLDILENQRVRLPVLLPNDSPQFLELGERLMMARNNAGVTYEALAKQTGKRDYRSKALSLYADSARSWDAITRNPQSMTRMTIGDTPGAPGINLGYLNANNALHPTPGFTPEIFIRIDRDVSEPSHWEELAPFGGLFN